MKLEQIQLHIHNQVFQDYWLDNTEIHDFFTYRYCDESFAERMHYLQQQTYHRAELVDIIRSYMQPFGISESCEKHLQALLTGAPVVVGGQQSGLLTGPLYSVYKAITVILLAKEQTSKLGQDVVPLFWIAGEDHDIDEINHIFTIDQSEVKKRGYSERSNRKTTASETTLNREAILHFIDTVFRDYGETAYTANLLQDLKEAVHHSSTFTAFFTYVMNDLFKAHGLLMLDAAFPLFRQFESEKFKMLIEHSAAIAEVVTEKERALGQAGYGAPIQANAEAANLFYLLDNERFLLERKNDHFVNVSANIQFTKEELLHIAQTEPQKLSNNVVTRPLMQEMTIPVLAFVGGMGELAYWATLKDAFEVVGLQMPIFVPRLQVTIVTRQVEQLLQSHSLNVLDALQGKAQQLKKHFLQSIQDIEASRKITEMEALLQTKYDELSHYMNEQNLQLNKVISKNRDIQFNQFQYLRQKLQQAIELKHSVALKQFDTLTSEMLPNGGYQERAYSPYQYMNIYGPTFIDDLLAQEWTISSKHTIVRL